MLGVSFLSPLFLAGALAAAPSTSRTNSPLSRFASASSHAAASDSAQTWIVSYNLVSSRAMFTLRSPNAFAMSRTLATTRCGAS